MRRTTLVLARITALCAVLQTAAVASAQPRPAEVAAETRRAEVLAQAAQLTVAQARTVFAQIEPAPLSPTIHDIVVDTRPDGARHVFGLMDVDPRRECSVQGFPASDCGDPGVQTWVFFTQVHADGRVLQTGFDLPFAVTPRSATTTRAVALRLFTPASPSEPKVVLVDGVRTGRQSYQHQLWIWDGRGGYDMPGASSLIERGPGSGGAALMSVALDEAGHRVVVTSLECERGCRCTIPRAPADEAAQLARLVQRQPTACTPRERVFPFPPGLHLIDEDLDARAPTGTEAEVVAAVVPDLVRASGLTPAQAEAALAFLRGRYLFAPHFSRFVTVTNADRSRGVYGMVETRQYDLCIVRRRERSLYDAARACAWNTMGSNHLLSIAVSPGGEVTAARLTEVYGETLALHLTRTASGTVVPIVETSRTPAYTVRAFVHALQIVDGPGPGRRESITDAQFVGELITRPAGAPFVTLTRRRSACSNRCPCEPTPRSLSEARAALAARAATSAPACGVEEVVLP